MVQFSLYPLELHLYFLCAILMGKMCFGLLNSFATFFLSYELKENIPDISDISDISVHPYNSVTIYKPDYSCCNCTSQTSIFIILLQITGLLLSTDQITAVSGNCTSQTRGI